LFPNLLAAAGRTGAILTATGDALQMQSSRALMNSCMSSIRQQIWVSSVSGSRWVVTQKCASNGDTVARHLNQHDPFDWLLRTNRAVVLGVLWAALAACVVASMVYDVADWISAW